MENLGISVEPVVWPVFFVVLPIALVVGGMCGTVGAAANQVKTWDEFLLWMIGGAIGGVCAVFGWIGIILGVCAPFELDPSVAHTATTGLIIFGTAALFGAVLGPLLDDTDSPLAWLVSFVIKWAQSPVLTTAGLVATLIVVTGGGKIDFRRGMLFMPVGPGRGALTLGAVGWTQSGWFTPRGTVPDTLARHESLHSRTVAAIGELGFYLTYVTIGALWGLAQGGSWNNLTATGCGNPFEKTAHTFTGDPPMPRSASDCAAKRPNSRGQGRGNLAG